MLDFDVFSKLKFLFKGWEMSCFVMKFLVPKFFRSQQKPPASHIDVGLHELHLNLRCFYAFIQITLRFVYFCCSASHPDIVGDSRHLLDVRPLRNYSVNGVEGNPRSFSVVTHSSWCPVEFGQVPICGREDISHNLLLL